MPQMLSLPMLPPGNCQGETMQPAVVKAALPVVGGEVGVLEVMRKDARDERGRLAAARAVRECDTGIVWEFSSHDHKPP